MKFRLAAVRFFVAVLAAELAVMACWFTLTVVTGDNLSMEGMLALSAICLGFIAVGGLIVGLPMALIAERQRWGNSYAQLLTMGAVSEGIAATLMTFAIFLDGPEVAIALVKFVLPFGAIAGLVAAFVWYKFENVDCLEKLT